MTSTKSIPPKQWICIAQCGEESCRSSQRGAARTPQNPSQAIFLGVEDSEVSTRSPVAPSTPTLPTWNESHNHSPIDTTLALFDLQAIPIDSGSEATAVTSPFATMFHVEPQPDTLAPHWLYLTCRPYQVNSPTNDNNPQIRLLLAQQMVSMFAEVDRSRALFFRPQLNCKTPCRYRTETTSQMGPRDAAFAALFFQY